MVCVKKTFYWFLPAIVAAAVGLFIAGPALAGIAITGDVMPSDSADWGASTDVLVGETGAGTVVVDSGDDLFSNNSFVGGYIFGSGTTAGTGTVTVTGSGSSWTAQSLIVGSSNGLSGCKGTLYVQNGGRVDVLEGLNLSAGLGFGSALGEAYVDGSNSVLDVDGGIYVGSGHSGTFSVTGGGAVNSARGAITNDSVVTVDGNGTTWNTSGFFYVGDGTDGTLNITNQSAVSMGNLYVGQNSSSGLIDFGTNGGTLTTKTLCATPSQLTGSGKVVTHGLIADINLTFDSTSSLIQTPSGYESDNVTLDVVNSSFVGDLGIGYNGTGTLFISNGVNVYSASGFLGNLYDATQSSGTATVNAATWNLSGDLMVGYNEGRGKLFIQNGGTVSVDGKTVVGETYGISFGTISLDGGTLDTQSLCVAPNKLVGSGQVITRGLVSDVNLTFDATHGLSQSLSGFGSVAVTLDMSNSNNVGDLGVGYYNTGITLRIADGVAVTSLNGSVAEKSGTTGTATVDAASWNVKSRLSVGVYGYGKLYVLNGASVQCDEAVFGSASQGTITVDGSGSTLDVNSKCWISGGAPGVFSGFAKIDITNGGVFTTPDAGLQIDGSHEITVDGSGSAWNIGSGTISELGMITISNGGAINTRGSVDVYTPAMLLDGGNVKATANSSWYYHHVGGGSVAIGSQGAKFDSNGYALGFNLTLADEDSSTGSLTKIGAGTLTLTPSHVDTTQWPFGTAIATNTYTGVTTVEAGQLTLGGKEAVTEPGAWNPVLNLGGADVQAGKLVFDYTGGTSPAATVLSLLGTSYGTGWASGQIYSTTVGSDYTLGWMDDGVSQVTVMYTLEGDSNLDGSVNGTDLNAVLSYYNQSGEVWAHGDFNYDGSVNGTDLNSVLSYYNQSLSSSTAAVPEPSTLLLMVLGLLGLLVWRRVCACTHR